MGSAFVCSCHPVRHELSHGHFWSLELWKISNTLYHVNLLGLFAFGDNESEVRRPSEEVFVAFWRSYFIWALNEMEFGGLVLLELLYERCQLDLEFLGIISGEHSLIP